MNSYKQSPRFIQAKKRVNQMKRFYRHLSVYVVVNGILLILKLRLFDFFTQQGITDEGFYDWLNWNIIGTPILWGIGLLVHGIYVFGLKSRALKDIKPEFIKKWEVKKLEEFLREEERNDKPNEQ